MARGTHQRSYTIGFLQTVMVGNKYRFELLREFVEHDDAVSARWYPLRSWVTDDWLRILPGWFRIRVRHLFDSARLFTARDLEAVVVHAPEMYGPYGWFHRLTRRPSVLVENSDAPTIPHGKVGARLLASAQQNTTLFVPWSNYVRDAIQRDFPDAADRMVVLHPGLPLDRWPLRPPGERSTSSAARLLFVGGDAVRKGLDTLVDAFEQRLGRACELDVATQAQGLPDWLARRMDGQSGIRVHLDLQPGSPEVQDLFRRADALVLPTRYDLSPWVVLEAMATGIPVIASDVGGISDMVVDGETGMLTVPDDPAALADAVERLRALPPDRIIALVHEARRHVELHFDAAVNTTDLLDLVKQAIDARSRSGHASEVGRRWGRAVRQSAGGGTGTEGTPGQ